MKGFGIMFKFGYFRTLRTLILAMLTYCMLTVSSHAEASQIVYLLASAGVKPDAPGLIYQMSEGTDGTLRLKSTTKLPPGYLPSQACFSSGEDRLYVETAKGASDDGPVFQFEIEPNGHLLPISPAILPSIATFFLTPSPDGRFLITEDADLNSLQSLSIRGDGSLATVGTWREAPSASAHDSSRQSALLAFSFGPGPYLYAADVHNNGCALLRFKLAATGQIVPLGKTLTYFSSPTCVDIDKASRVLYWSSIIDGTVGEYKVAQDGDLSALQIPGRAMLNLTNGGDDGSSDSQPGGGNNGKLVPLYPAPPPPLPSASPIAVPTIKVDSADGLLFGVGGASGNEIDDWSISSSGISKLLHRYWYNKSGIFSDTNPQAQNSDQPDGSVSMPCTVYIDNKMKHLYLLTSFLTVADKTYTKDVYCFGIGQDGELHSVTAEPIVGLNLHGLNVTSMYFLGQPQ